MYNLSGKGVKTRILSVPAGTSQRTDINEGVLNNPSPSHYNPNHPSIVTHSVSFPKNSKQVEHGNDNPDPGYYKADNNMVK